MLFSGLITTVLDFNRQRVAIIVALSLVIALCTAACFQLWWTLTKNARLPDRRKETGKCTSYRIPISATSTSGVTTTELPDPTHIV